MDLDELLSAGQELFAKRYRIERLLGTGGMGKVYLAHDTMLDCQVCLKMLHSQLCQDPKHTKRFLREVQLTRQFAHPNVVRTYDVDTEDGRLYFTMEYVEGVTLKERMGPEKISLPDACLVFLGILKGLSAIHQAGVVHRDLKPGNVIVTPEGVPKITDFGVARPGISDLTGSDEIVGSVPYMAPEIWRGETIAEATDIYALGVLVYELFTGVLPFDGETPAEFMCKHLETQPLPLYELTPEMPEWLSNLVLRMLSKDQTQRPSSYLLIAELENQLFQAPEPLDEPPMEELRYEEMAMPEATPNENMYSGFLNAPPQLTPLVAESNENNSGVVLLSRKLSQSHTRDINPLLQKIGGLFALVAVATLVSLVILGPVSSFVTRLLAAASAGSSLMFVAALASAALSLMLLAVLPLMFLVYPRRSVLGSLETWSSTALTLFCLIGLMVAGRMLLVGAQSSAMWRDFSPRSVVLVLHETVDEVIHATTFIPSTESYVPKKGTRIISADKRSLSPWWKTLTIGALQFMYLMFLGIYIVKDLLQITGGKRYVAAASLGLVGLFSLIEGLVLSSWDKLGAANAPFEVAIGPFVQVVTRPCLLVGLINWFFVFVAAAFCYRKWGGDNLSSASTPNI